MKTHPITIIALIILILAGFVILNRMSYQDGLDDQAWKCKMIEERVWPDVDGYHDRVCKP